MKNHQQICSRCVLPDTFPGITFDDKGVCSECKKHDLRWAEWEAGFPERNAKVERLIEDAKKRCKEFDALVPLSGGKDSMYVLYKATKEFGLHCMAYTLDNGYLSNHARANIDRACHLLGVEHVYYCFDPDLMNRLFALFMKKTGDFCSVCMRAIGMATEKVADMYDIPLILQGSSARTELVVSREMFEPGPPTYIRKVLEGEPIGQEAERLLFKASLRRRLGYRVFRMEHGKRIRFYGGIKLPDYIDWNYDIIYRVIIEEMGWQPPPGDKEHYDCNIHPVTTYAHNRRFPGLEIRRLTLARLVMVGQLSREEALMKLAEEGQIPVPDSILKMLLINLKMTKDEFDQYIDMGPRHLLFQPK